MATFLESSQMTDSLLSSLSSIYLSFSLHLSSKLFFFHFIFSDPGVLGVRSIVPFFLQCVQSSLSQNGGAYLRSPCSGKFLKALKWSLKCPQLVPAMFGNAQRSIWWVAGSEQPSPPLRPLVSDLLNGNQLLHQYLS